MSENVGLDFTVGMEVQMIKGDNKGRRGKVVEVWDVWVRIQPNDNPSVEARFRAKKTSCEPILLSVLVSTARRITVEKTSLSPKKWEDAVPETSNRSAARGITPSKRPAPSEPITMVRNVSRAGSQGEGARVTKRQKIGFMLTDGRDDDDDDDTTTCAEAGFWGAEIRNWRHLVTFKHHGVPRVHVVGYIFNSAKYPDGQTLTTSHVVCGKTKDGAVAQNVQMEKGIVIETFSGSKYLLGRQET